MAEDGSYPPAISISRTSSKASSKRKGSPQGSRKWSQAAPRFGRKNTWNTNLRQRGLHAKLWEQRMGKSDVEWHIKWTKDCFANGRVLIIDYISNTADSATSGSSKKHIVVAAQEFESLRALERFYTDKDRAQGAALRVIHVQNATWATNFLLRKFNIDHDNEMLGMQGFTKWARYSGPRQKGGKPFPNGRSWRESTDPWRNVSRTAFGLDYLKVFESPDPRKRHDTTVYGQKPVNAHMMHLNAYESERSPHGYDVSVQRLNVYVQRNLGTVVRLSPEDTAKNPYITHAPNGQWSKVEDDRVDVGYLDNSNTVIILETSASLLHEDCLIQPRNEIENRWRRLAFYLKKEDARSDARLAAQCTNMVLSDIFHGLAVSWTEFLSVGGDHVNLLQDKIYDNPADESRAPELWTNQATWLKVDKVMYIHQDLVKEMQGHLHDLAEVDLDVDGDSQSETQTLVEWLSSTPAEYERLAHSVQEDLVLPTANLSDLMYKSVGIRDSRQSLELGLSMWRLSWITFIFLPLSVVVGFFGMNVNIFEGSGGTGLPSVGWYFLSAVMLMILVLILWYFVKHSLQLQRQSPYQRGFYEQLFNDLEDEYPLMWSSEGALEYIEPDGFINRMKWRLLTRWFAPDKTIHKKLYSSLSPDGNGADLGTWPRVKRDLLLRWLPQMQLKHSPDDAISITEVAEQGLSTSAPASLRYQPGAMTELAKMSAPVVIAEAEPAAVQQISRFGLRPLSVEERRRRSSSAGAAERYSQERPSSRGSSGIMFEERNLSDSESDAGEGASSSQERSASASKGA